jgi:predicted enzyme related to lactoylglutathione lyase
MPDYPAGTPMWIDLGTPDVDASISFYGDLFGWSAGDALEGGGGYRFFEQDGKMVAGLGPLMQEGQHPAWTTYVAVDDATETVEKARAAGGAVYVEPMDVMDAGRMALVADPTGAALGLWQPKRHTGAEIVNEPVSLAWNELNTRDGEAATAFYTAVFGWTAEASPAGSPAYTTWQLGGKPVAGMFTMTDEIPAHVPAHWLAYFAVADTDDTVARATAAGGALMAGPIDIPAGRFAVLQDPHGTGFGVIRM